MLAEYQKKSNYGIAIGLLLQIASVPLGDTIISLLVLLAGAGFLIYGCCCYAIGKGHSGGFGLLGIGDVRFVVETLDGLSGENVGGWG